MNESKSLEQLGVEERRRYQREWRKRNPEKVREKNKAYWEKRAQKRLAAQSEEEGGDSE